MSAKEDIGLVGIGLVGTAVAEHLLDAGYRVIGCDIDRYRRAALESLGGVAVEKPSEVAERAERVILSLMTSNIVHQVVEGPDGLLAASQAPRLIVDTSTGDPEETEALASRLAARDVAYLDATISGASQQIRERQAVFLVGGTPEAFAAGRELLEIVAEKIFHLGPSGSGARAKLASNLVLGLNRLALAEGLVCAEALGLDLAPFLEVLKATPAYSTAMDVKGEKMLLGDFTPQSKARQHYKDLTRILDYAARAGRELPLARVHAQVLERLIDAGDGDLDASAVIKALR